MAHVAGAEARRRSLIERGFGTRLLPPPSLQESLGICAPAGLEALPVEVIRDLFHCGGWPAARVPSFMPPRGLPATATRRGERSPGEISCCLSCHPSHSAPTSNRVFISHHTTSVHRKKDLNDKWGLQFRTDVHQLPFVHSEPQKAPGGRSPSQAGGVPEAGVLLAYEDHPMLRHELPRFAQGRIRGSVGRMAP